MKKYPYSEQADVLLKSMIIDQDDLQKWFEENLVIGSQNVLQYLLTKKKNGSQ